MSFTINKEFKAFRHALFTDKLTETYKITWKDYVFDLVNLRAIAWNEPCTHGSWSSFGGPVVTIRDKDGLGWSFGVDSFRVIARFNDGSEEEHNGYNFVRRTGRYHHDRFPNYEFMVLPGPGIYTISIRVGGAELEFRGVGTAEPLPAPLTLPQALKRIDELETSLDEIKATFKKLIT